jgi:hypothetical protein
VVKAASTDKKPKEPFLRVKENIEPYVKTKRPVKQWGVDLL